VVCVTVEGIESIRQVDSSTVFEGSGEGAGACPLLVAYWDIETYTA
jgi:hypothetical protein